MLKRCLLAVIVALLVTMTSSQVAAAEDYDWSQAKRIGTKAELARYIECERRKGNTKIRVILTNGMKITDKVDFANIALCLDVNGTWHINNDGTMQIDYDITEYPGTRVANAYLSRNQQQAWMNLNQEEQALFNIAVGIVDEANKRLSEREKAEYIHDEIIKILGRDNFEIIDGATAINALIYKKTDCEGFADAFYMLGRMAGLNVRRIRGSINNGTTPHGWNTITFSDGRTYCIDVTQDYVESEDKHKYFIVPSQTLKNNSYWCHWDIIPNLQ